MGGLEIMLTMICLNNTICEPTAMDNNTVSVEIETDGLAMGNNFVNKTAIMNELKRNYSGKHLKIGTVQNYPLSCAIRKQNGTLEGCGIAFEFVEILKEMFNFTYEVVLPAENLEGSKSNPENSLLGLLHNGKIDLAAAFLPVLSNSLDYVRYSASLDEGVWVIMMKRPSESAGGSGLLAPFDQIVWYLIVIAVLSFGPFIYITTWVRHKITKDKKNKPYGMSACYWFVYGALIKQGSTLSPDSNTTRVLFATWWIFITLLSAFYTANLTAFLTLSKFTLAINEPQDLIKKNNKWVAKKGSAVEYVVTNPQEDLYFLNKMVVKNRASFQPSDDDASFLTFVKNDFVFVRDKPAVEHLMYNDYKNKTKENIEENLRCTFVVTQNPFMKRARAFAYRPDGEHSNMRLLFDPVLLSLVESGIVKYKTRYELPANEICPLNLNSKERRLRNSDLLMTYMCAGFGIVCATIAFVIEIIFFYRDRMLSKSFNKKDFNDNINTISKSKFGKVSPGPPPYQTLFQVTDSIYDAWNNEGKRQHINGRDYWVIKDPSGDTRLIPVRTPSAFLFQYTS